MSILTNPSHDILDGILRLGSMGRIDIFMKDSLDVDLAKRSCGSVLASTTCYSYE